MIVIVMGVSGSGKTTVGKLIADAMGWRFEDADDYHSAENKAKMSSGHGLNDHDREPWLASLRAMIEDRLERNQETVVACSALRSVYRQMLIPPSESPIPSIAESQTPSSECRPGSTIPPEAAGARGGKQVPSKVVFLYLKASLEEIASRLAHRKHEFMNPSLLRSQFQTLEEPTDSEASRTIVVDTYGLTAEQVATEAVSRLQT